MAWGASSGASLPLPSSPQVFASSVTTQQPLTGAQNTQQLCPEYHRYCYLVSFLAVWKEVLGAHICPALVQLRDADNRLSGARRAEHRVKHRVPAVKLQQAAKGAASWGGAAKCILHGFCSTGVLAPTLCFCCSWRCSPCCAMLCCAVPPHATLSTSAPGDSSGGLGAAGSSSSSRRGQGSERHQRGLAGGSRQRGDHMAARWD